MTLQRDAKSLLLLPKQANAGFETGSRGGATFSAGQGSYWPFRPLTLAEELALRERIDAGI
jgi:hypothetical protein